MLPTMEDYLRYEDEWQRKKRREDWIFWSHMGGGNVEKILLHYAWAYSVSINAEMRKEMRKAIVNVFPDLTITNRGDIIYNQKKLTKYIMIYEVHNPYADPDEDCVIVGIGDNKGNVCNIHYYFNTPIDVQNIIQKYEHNTNKTVYIISNDLRYIKGDNAYHINNIVDPEFYMQDLRQFYNEKIRTGSYKYFHPIEERIDKWDIGDRPLTKEEQERKEMYEEAYNNKYCPICKESEERGIDCFYYKQEQNLFLQWLVWGSPYILLHNPNAWIDQLPHNKWYNKTTTDIYKQFCCEKNIDYDPNKANHFGRLLTKRYQKKSKRIDGKPYHVCVGRKKYSAPIMDKWVDLK